MLGASSRCVVARRYAMEAASHLELSGVVYPACDPSQLPAGATNAAQLAAAAQAG